jgi:ubiquinone/menaquinone biosynthesis C-methylase UbiE
MANPDADLGLGCGIPTQFANIKKGDAVLDLGSGAGNDCFVARALVGDMGSVTGLDFTNEMIQKANANLKKLGYSNVRFIKGEIEDMPLGTEQFDVILSNCVLNLVPDKNKAFAEMFRVLKRGGHFCVSDVVIKGELPEKLKTNAEMYAGCVSGAIQMDLYLEMLRNNGFENISIKKEKQVNIPDEILANYLSTKELLDYKNSNIGIFSITIYGDKK